MPFGSDQIAFIQTLDHKAKQIMRHAGEDELLASLCEQLQDIRPLIDKADPGELDKYCQQYEGFYQYMKLLERLAQASASGAFDK